MPNDTCAPSLCDEVDTARVHHSVPKSGTYLSGLQQAHRERQGRLFVPPVKVTPPTPPPPVVAAEPEPPAWTAPALVEVDTPTPGPMPMTSRIIKRVARHYRISVVEMCSHRRERHIARPRQVAMYLIKTLTLRSLPEIGRRLGGRDHTTVLHGVRKIKELLAIDPDLVETIAYLKQELSI